MDAISISKDRNKHSRNTGDMISNSFDGAIMKRDPSVHSVKKDESSLVAINAEKHPNHVGETSKVKECQ